tara:strand:- start:444 stop:1397 length:954 start_codon:yes stop_codon:yes gene_type:complete
MVITVLNIPNFYSSYYLLGLHQEFKIRFKKDSRFVKYYNRPFLIFKVNDKIGVINNDDPSSVIKELYDLSTLYFVTNKLKDEYSYSQEKVKPLFPHYPINILLLYLRIFGFNLFIFLKFKDIIHEIYTYIRRPHYKNQEIRNLKKDYVFFSARIWKKESEANRIRAEFIKFCKSESRIKFEGGFVPRIDGKNLGFDNEVNKLNYSAVTFSKLSARSKVVLNNPAVGGAVSWRLAEYLNQGLFVLSFPFKIELPQNLDHGKELHFVESTMEYKTVFDKIFDEPDYHEKVSRNGKYYFDSFCTPRAQAKYIIDLLLRYE